MHTNPDVAPDDTAHVPCPLHVLPAHGEMSQRVVELPVHPALQAHDAPLTLTPHVPWPSQVIPEHAGVWQEVPL